MDKDEESIRALRGFARLTQEIVKSALFHTQDIYDGGGMNIKETNRIRKINRDFAKHSKILHHFCDVYEYDHQRIKDKILKCNMPV